MERSNRARYCIVGHHKVPLCHRQPMEASTSAFFGRPRSALRKMGITSVTRQDGRISSDPVDITAEFQAHWGSIFGDARYCSESLRVNDSTRNQLLDSVPGASNLAALSDLVTYADLAESIRHHKPRSDPGLDGLPAASYQIAPDEFGSILATVFNFQLSRGTLLLSQRKSGIILL